MLEPSFAERGKVPQSKPLITRLWRRTRQSQKTLIMCISRHCNHEELSPGKELRKLLRYLSSRYIISFSWYG